MDSGESNVGANASSRALEAASFNESIAAAESAAATLASCEDVDEALRLFRAGEAGLRRAETRLAEVERELRQVLEADATPPSAPTEEKLSYAECLRVAKEATRALGTCNDAEEALRLLRLSESSLHRADLLLEAVEGEMRRVAPSEYVDRPEETSDAAPHMDHVEAQRS